MWWTSSVSEETWCHWDLSVVTPVTCFLHLSSKTTVVISITSTSGTSCSFVTCRYELFRLQLFFSELKECDEPTRTSSWVEGFHSLPYKRFVFHCRWKLAKKPVQQMVLYTRAHYTPTLKLLQCYKTDFCRLRLKWASGKENRTGYEECSADGCCSYYLELPLLQLPVYWLSERSYLSIYLSRE